VYQAYRQGEFATRPSLARLRPFIFHSSWNHRLLAKEGSALFAHLQNRPYGARDRRFDTGLLFGGFDPSGLEHALVKLG
jgi:hypothetical protein